MKPLFVLAQYCVPQLLITKLAAWLMNIKTPWFKNRIIHWFIQRYGVNMSEAAREQVEDYQNFNDFFTRALKRDVRPMPQDMHAIISPVDGLMSECGQVHKGILLQAKGVSYSLQALLANQQVWGERYQTGAFATFYLSPKDYHCVHMPIDGRLIKTCYVPGQLFSVNTLTAAHVPGLFARNERLICEFETAEGPMILIFVGAMIVAGIETVWGGQVRRLDTLRLKNHNSIAFKRGDKLGHFNLGSTVILLFQKSRHWQKKSIIKLGETIA